MAEELMAITHDGKKIYFQKERNPFRNITEREKKLIQEALSHMVYEYFPRIIVIVSTELWEKLVWLK
ncbi:MAG: hypothetical protein V8R51_07380 [Clostridia bacterium]